MQVDCTGSYSIVDLHLIESLPCAFIFSQRQNATLEGSLAQNTRMYSRLASEFPTSCLSSECWDHGHASSCVTMRPYASTCITMCHHASPCVTMHQHASTCVTMHHFYGALNWSHHFILFSSSLETSSTPGFTTICFLRNQPYIVISVTILALLLKSWTL